MPRGWNVGTKKRVTVHNKRRERGGDLREACGRGEGDEAGGDSRERWKR